MTYAQLNLWRLRVINPEEVDEDHKMHDLPKGINMRQKRIITKEKKGGCTLCTTAPLFLKQILHHLFLINLQQSPINSPFLDLVKCPHQLAPSTQPYPPIQILLSTNSNSTLL